MTMKSRARKANEMKMSIKYREEAKERKKRGERERNRKKITLKRATLSGQLDCEQLSTIQWHQKTFFFSQVIKTKYTLYVYIHYIYVCYWLTQGIIIIRSFCQIFSMAFFVYAIFAIQWIDPSIDVKILLLHFN